MCDICCGENNVDCGELVVAGAGPCNPDTRGNKRISMHVRAATATEQEDIPANTFKDTGQRKHTNPETATAGRVAFMAVIAV